MAWPAAGMHLLILCLISLSIAPVPTVLAFSGTKKSGQDYIVEVLGGSPTASEYSLNVEYDQTKVYTGMNLSPDTAAYQPEVKVQGPDVYEQTFTLALIDPDAPSPDNPTNAEWLHWLVVNIPGGNVREGIVVTPYMGPSPPRGQHRYIFALYKQSNRGPLQVSKIGQRGRFSLREFASTFALGPPVATKFFYSSPQ